MSDKPVLHYWNGRGRAEIVRLFLTAAGIEVRKICVFEAFLIKIFSINFSGLRNISMNQATSML